MVWLIFRGIAQVLRTEDPTVLMDGMQSFAQMSSVGREWKLNLLVICERKYNPGIIFICSSNEVLETGKMVWDFSFKI